MSPWHGFMARLVRGPTFTVFRLPSTFAVYRAANLQSGTKNVFHSSQRFRPLWIYSKDGQEASAPAEAAESLERGLRPRQGDVFLVERRPGAEDGGRARLLHRV